MAITGFAIGVLLVAGGIWASTRGGELNQMAASGQRVPAKVVDAREEKKRTRRNGRTRTTYDYFVTVSFTHPDGRPIQKEREVSSSVHSHYGTCHGGASMPTTVVINPADPSDWLIEEQLQSKQASTDTMAWLLPLIGLGFFGMGVFGTVSHMRRRNNSPTPAPGYGYPPSQTGGPVPYPQPPANPDEHVIYDARREPHRPH